MKLLQSAFLLSAMVCSTAFIMSSDVKKEESTWSVNLGSLKAYIPFVTAKSKVVPTSGAVIPAPEVKKEVSKKEAFVNASKAKAQAVKTFVINRAQNVVTTVKNRKKTAAVAAIVLASAVYYAKNNNQSSTQEDTDSEVEA